MSKKSIWILSIILVAIILGGIFIYGSSRGWFGSSADVTSLIRSSPSPSRSPSRTPTPTGTCNIMGTVKFEDPTKTFSTYAMVRIETTKEIINHVKSWGSFSFSKILSGQYIVSAWYHDIISDIPDPPLSPEPYLGDYYESNKVSVKCEPGKNMGVVLTLKKITL